MGKFVEDKVKAIMDKTSFLKLDKVIEMYQDVFSIKLPDTWINFKDAIDNRHFIFHKNGKNMLGKELEISTQDISTLIKQVRNFISTMEINFSAHIKEKKETPSLY